MHSNTGIDGCGHNLMAQPFWENSTVQIRRRSIVASMEHHALKNVKNCLNTNTYSYLETSGGQSSNLYLYVVLFFNISVN
jgi:hypothetical protein